MKTQAGKKRTIRDLPVELLLMTLMSASMAYPFVTALELGKGAAFVIGVSVLFVVLWTVALYNNRTMLIAAVLLGVAACGLALLYLSHSDSGVYSSFHYTVSDFLYWADMYLKGYRTTNAAFGTALVVLFSAFVCFAVALFTIRRFSLLAVVLCGAACFASLFIIGHIINIPSLFGYILASVFYFLLHSYKIHAKEQVPGKSLQISSFMASALPLAAIVLALTILLSKAMEINPSWMKETRDKLIKKSQPVSDGVSKASGTLVVSSDELGGNLYLNDDVVMVVASPVGNVYLRSLSKDEYTGHSWKQTDTNAINFDAETEKLSDTRELKEVGPSLAKGTGVFDKLFPLYELTVKYTGADPGIVYAPLKTSGLDVPGGAILVGSDELMFTNSPESGVSYTLRFYQPQYGTEDFAKIARKSSDQLYTGMAAAGGNKADIAMRYANIGGKLEKYLQLPERLPKKVRDLALDITKNETNDYDRAKAIERYLSEHYSYTLTPGSVDKNIDFVYNFLFVNKKGYCTYYASAMAVLLRCVGIPSRYVEGYVLPERAATGLFNVTKRQGHAWVEAYFQGIGWLQFEPTASFSGDVSPATPEPNGSPSAPPASVLHSPTPKPGSTLPAGEKPVSGNSAGGQKLNLLPLLPFAVVALLFALLLLAHRANANLRGMNPKDAALRLFSQYVRLLALQGVSLQDGETSKQFAERVDKLYGFSGSAFVRATEVFQLARYSEHEVTKEQKSLMLTFRNTLLTASRRKLQWIRYLFFKLIWWV